MLKGKMKIEMTDVHTGETQTVLEENMVTDALAQLFRPLGIAKSPDKWLSGFAPFYQKLTGGLVLFDNEIPENPTQYYAPATANPVGYAVYNEQNNTKGTLRGGFNQTESELNLKDRYVKYVYDFSTSQANGDIACVCLTHVKGGYNGYGGKDAVHNGQALAEVVDNGQLQYVYPSYTGASTSDKYSGYTVGTTEMLFLIDRETDSCYYWRVDSTNKITIIRRRAYLKSVSLLENPHSVKTYVDEVEKNLNTPFFSTNYLNYYFDVADNCLYIISPQNSYVDPNQEVLVTRIHVMDWNTTQFRVTNTSGVRLNFYGMRSSLVHRGFLFARRYDSPYSLYKIEIANPANCVMFENVGFSNVSATFQYAVEGRVYMEYATRDAASSYLLVANMDDNRVMQCEICYLYSYNYAYCYTPVLNEPMLWYMSAGNYNSTGSFVMFCNYLATINNLSEPVSKTADKTMKVTYIIQEQ